MAAKSPSPSSPSLTVPPAPNSTSTTQPPQASSPPPTPLTSSPSSQPNANSPETTNSTSNSPPPQSSPPPTAPLSPPPQPPVVSPPPLVPPTAPPSNPQSPPPTSPPPSPTSSGAPPPSTSGSSLPPETSPPPPPPSSTPPISSGAPPPSTSGSSPPPETSPPPPSSTPPVSSPPPPSSNPPANSPPSPSSKPPKNSPPSPSAQPPQTSPPPPSPISPESPPSPPASSPPPSSSPTPPPPKSVPPTSSPPPAPTLISPERSPPPASIPPKNAPAPPRLPPPAPSGSNSTPAPEKSRPEPSPSPPSPIIRLSPPPSSPVSPQPPSGVPNSPSDNGTSNGTSPNVPGSANTGGGISTGGLVAIGVIAGIIVLSLIGLAVWCLRKRRKKVSALGGHVMPSPLGSSPESAFFKAHSSAPLIGSRPSSDFVDTPTEPGGLGHSRSWFTFEELAQATNGFSDQNLLGEGGFGPVYRGYLPDGREIAVKQLKVGGGQGEREFKAEVEIISRIHHRHLVSLVGYCISENRRLLVYDYVPNNNLYYHLQAEGQPVLEWAIRVKIAAGAARGIAYLHEDCQPRIIHRDIKSSNILLDNNFEARVSDFGLAKLALDADTHISTRVIGTFGYLAPEYASSGKLTEKSDVYSFGVVLLELITGRKPVDPSRPLGEESLVEWARPLLGNVLESGELDGLVDPRLERNFMESEMLRMIEIAATCVRHSSAKRPRMGQVVRAFDSLAAADITNGMRVGESELFNSAQQSEEIRWFRRMAFGSQDYSTDFFSQDSLRSSRETTVHIE